MNAHLGHTLRRPSRRRGRCVAADGQPELFLELTANPESESALRAAFDRLGLERFVSFEQAMADPSYAIGIRNFTHASLQRLRR
jgi:hypothetical protein